MTSSHARLNWSEFRELAPGANSAMLALGQAIRASGLDPVLVELVNLRASQINGCSFCVQYHINSLRQLAAPQTKLDLLAGWRDAEIFSERERAAFAWAEALTVLDREGSPDAVYAGVSKHFSKNELAFLTAAVAAINAWNRISIGFRFPPPPATESSGGHKP